ncbi:hypothetical protein [Pseudanabaena sp. PCC 6802]|uniref:hypothetical protein n=1 Tax=Pseudanabaena sp. PCC 6802 TaxID=118173 RepID=UPI0012EA931E|nr:hypothetical protein [Pseudanabaena sp. PCC 6802]
MKSVYLPIFISLLVAISTPLTAMAQSRSESRPDKCEYLQNGEYICSFRGADTGETVISAFPNSIRRQGRQGAVNFDYMTSSRLIRNQAQVNCHESLDRWHRFADEYRAELVDVTTYASHKMLNYVCEQAGHSVEEQINR